MWEESTHNPSRRSIQQIGCRSQKLCMLRLKTRDAVKRSTQPVSCLKRPLVSQRPIHSNEVLRHENPLVSSATTVSPCYQNLKKRLKRQGLPKSNTPAPPTLPRRGIPQKRQIPNVKKVVAVASGKGGVGKSTISCMFFS